MYTHIVYIYRDIRAQAGRRAGLRHDLLGRSGLPARVLAGVHPVSITRFPSFWTQPQESLSRYQ